LSTNDTLDRLRAAAARVAGSYGLEIFDVQFRREAGGSRFMFITFAYMMALAYAAAFVTYRTAVALGAGSSSVILGNLADAYLWVPGQEQKAMPVYRQAIELAVGTDFNVMGLSGKGKVAAPVVLLVETWAQLNGAPFITLLEMVDASTLFASST